ncbi:MAG: copper chaperone [Methylococcaceae bacterium]|nr:copper chaperone [Methylococcaceae bacterium]
MTLKSGLLLISLLLPATLWMPVAYAEITEALPNQQQTVALKLENMTCAMCTVTIKKALQQVKGVQKVVIDYDTKTALVTFDDQKTSSAALIKATTDAGYPGSLVTSISQ